ncbi:hypothetical protein V6N11_004575 [Hibiscus sabdariffa]|uniref:Uncharacterized protein n=1 Tax=Hibiscus sabdariffa TaxID=183260 RepID=A0ABR2SHH3_9ROSI
MLNPSVSCLAKPSSDIGELEQVISVSCEQVMDQVHSNPRIEVAAGTVLNQRASDHVQMQLVDAVHAISNTVVPFPVEAGDVVVADCDVAAQVESSKLLREAAKATAQLLQGLKVKKNAKKNAKGGNKKGDGVPSSEGGTSTSSPS